MTEVAVFNTNDPIEKHTYTFTLKWVEEVATHFSIISWCARLIIHAEVSW